MELTESATAIAEEFIEIENSLSGKIAFVKQSSISQAWINPERDGELRT